MRDKLNKLSNWLNNNDLEEESSAVSKILSKYAEEDEESDDQSSGEYWDFSIDNVPDGWSSSNFSPEDLMSRGNRRVRMYKPALRALDNVASKRPAGKPVLLTNQVSSSKNGAYRDKRYNSSVGGASRSQHIEGKAFDIHVVNYDREERLLLLQALVDAGFKGFGHGKNVIHADFGSERSWTYAGYRKPSEEEYRGGSSGSVAIVSREPLDDESESVSSSEAKGCNPPFDKSLLEDVRLGGELKIGSKGRPVGYMQTLLEEHGHMLVDFGIDCIFKYETQGRLKDFQIASGVEPTGVLDNATLILLEKEPVSDPRGKASARTIEVAIHELDDKFSDWNRLGKFTKRKSNFHSIGDGKNNYRSAIPVQSIDFFRYLKEKYEIKHIVNLKSDRGEGRLVRQIPGLTYVNISLGSSPPDQTEWSQINSLLTIGNTLIHCRHGADRTGAVVARWKVENGLLTPEAALQEALRYGFKKQSHPGYTGDPEDADPNRKLRNYILASKQKRVLQAETRESDRESSIRLNGDVIYPFRRNANVNLVVFYHGTTGQSPILQQLMKLNMGNTIFLIPNGSRKSYAEVLNTINKLSNDYGITINSKKLGAWSAGSGGFAAAFDSDNFEPMMLADPSPNRSIMSNVPSNVYMEYNTGNWGTGDLARTMPALASEVEARGGIAKSMPGISHTGILASVLAKLIR